MSRFRRSPDRTRASSVAFWNTPPERTTCRAPEVSARREAASRIAAARVSWNRREIVPAGTRPSLASPSPRPVPSSLPQEARFREQGERIRACGGPRAAASSRIGACPSKLARAHSPAIAEAASKSRPALDVGTTLIPLSSASSRSRTDPRGPPGTAPAPSFPPPRARGPPAAARGRSATAPGRRRPRRGGGTAPGARRGVTSVPSTAKNSPPQMVPSSPYPVPSNATPTAFPGSPSPPSRSRCAPCGAGARRGGPPRRGRRKRS